MAFRQWQYEVVAVIGFHKTVSNILHSSIAMQTA